MSFLVRHLWAVAVVVVAINHLMGLKQLRAVAANDPVVQAKCERLLIGSTLFQLVPWIILGVGILAGSIDSVFAAFSSQTDNPYVTAVWLFAIAGSALVSLWILFAGGAVFVSRYGAGLLPQPVRVRHVRVIGALIGVAAVAMGWWIR